jgi:hypothetical protein
VALALGANERWLRRNWRKVRDRAVTFKILTRLLAIGLGMLIVAWVALVFWVGYKLNALPGDGQAMLGIDPLPLATGERAGPSRSFRIGLGGYLLGIILLVGPVALGWSTRKRPSAREL